MIVIPRRAYAQALAEDAVLEFALDQLNEMTRRSVRYTPVVQSLTDGRTYAAQEYPETVEAVLATEVDELAGVNFSAYVLGDMAGSDLDLGLARSLEVAA